MKIMSERGFTALIDRKDIAEIAEYAAATVNKEHLKYLATYMHPNIAEAAVKNTHLNILDIPFECIMRAPLGIMVREYAAKTDDPHALREIVLSSRNAKAVENALGNPCFEPSLTGKETLEKIKMVWESRSYSEALIQGCSGAKAVVDKLNSLLQNDTSFCSEQTTVSM